VNPSSSSNVLKQFALTGVCGFVANFHLEAIRKLQGNLLCAYDITSAGVQKIDFLFPGCEFVLSEKKFERELALKKDQINYLSICAPDCFHVPQTLLGLRHGLDVICEKPLTMNLEELDQLIKEERESGAHVYPIMQARYHSDIIALAKKLEADPPGKRLDVVLTYISPRGSWYLRSWHGDPKQATGIIGDIGIHFFDILLLLFGKVSRNYLHLADHVRCAGFIEFERADVRWYLSIDGNDLPKHMGLEPHEFRQLSFDGRDIDISREFRDLHTKAYETILEGDGLSIENVAPTLELCHGLRTSPLEPRRGELHPITAKIGSTTIR